MRSLAAAFGLTETSPPGPSPDRFDVELLKHPRSVAILLGITVVYFLAGKFGLSLAFLNASASPVWPPTGIALAAMLLMGRQIWPAVLLGAFIVNVTTTGEMFSSLGIALGNTAEAVVGAIFAKRFANGVHAFERPDSVLRYSFFTGMVATAVSATIGTATLLLFQQAEFLNAGLLWMTWWLGDFGGAVIVAPLLILWATQPEIPFRPVRILEGLGVLFIMWLSAHAVFGGVLPARGAPIMYLCIPALVYTAFRFGPRETATATALLAGVSIMGTVAGEGPFANVDDNAALLYLQGFMVVIGPTLLSLAAGVAIHRESQQGLLRARDELERRVQERTQELVAINAALQLEIQERARTEARVRRSEEGLLEAERLARLGNWSWDVATNRVMWSDELLRIYGLRPEDFSGTFEGFLDRLPPSDRAVAERIIGDSMENGRPFDFYHRVIRPDGTERILHARGTVEMDTTGHVIRMFGTGQDVTELKQAEAALRQAHEELERRVATRTRELAAANEQLHAKIEDLEAFEQAVVGRELKMIALERELDELRARISEMSRNGD